MYNNLAPKLGLLGYILFFFAYFIFQLLHTHHFDLLLVDVFSQALQYSIIAGVLGFSLGKMLSGKLQDHQLHVLQKERVRRRKSLKKQLQSKREALSKLEEMVT